MNEMEVETQWSCNIAKRNSIVIFNTGNKKNWYGEFYEEIVKGSFVQILVNYPALSQGLSIQLWVVSTLTYYFYERTNIYTKQG